MRGFFKGGLTGLHRLHFIMLTLIPQIYLSTLVTSRHTNIAQLENSSYVNDVWRQQCSLDNINIHMDINHRRPPHTSICRRIAEARCRVIPETNKPLYLVTCQASRNLRAGFF
ncbi:hypothetical protein BKA59DRAFT_468527 [Fusarium tricinctum]|uniref:Secreted protein n=1 Tax=Fusarium tricinctum TaxID=61284 RepID=A0A8K0S4U7_9HYPO|nr:hypothetical protein BKA59DRAFT_468527 [Fusarium tricinctum]